MPQADLNRRALFRDWRNGGPTLDEVIAALVALRTDDAAGLLPVKVQDPEGLGPFAAAIVERRWLGGNDANTGDEVIIVE